MDEARKAGPVLLLDSGNALFHFAGGDDTPARTRARFILSSMGALHTAAMAVGVRDLSAGATWLAEAARAAHVPALSANLEDTERRHPFPASTLVTAGGYKVGLLGLTAPGKHGGYVAGPLLPAARAAASALRAQGAQVVVVLAAAPYAEVQGLAGALGGEVELLLQSHEGRGASAPQAVGGAWIATSPDRGRGLGRLELQLEGKGPLRDAGEQERNREALVHLDTQVAEVHRRLAAASFPEVKAQLQQVLAGFERRRTELKAASGQGVGGRTLRLSHVALGQDVEGDRALDEAARKLEISPALH